MGLVSVQRKIKCRNRGCEVKNKAAASRWLKVQQSREKTEQEKLETLRRKLGQRKFSMDHFSLKQKHCLQVVTHPK